MKVILFITDLGVDTRIETLAGIREEISGTDYRVEMIESQRSTQPLNETLEFWNPAGCIVDAEERSHFESANPRNMPRVYLDAESTIVENPDFFSVTSSADQIAQLAAKELISCDCLSFAFAGWIQRAGWSSRRAAAFSNQLSRLGRKVSVFDGEFARGSMPAYTEALKRFLGSLTRPCGIMAANDFVASTIMAQCAHCGYSVPGDFFVVGVDDNPTFCDNTRPSLTSIRPDFKSAGAISARMLMRLIANPSKTPAKMEYHPAGITRRLSSRRISTKSKAVVNALDLIRREACTGLKAGDVVHAMGVTERLAETRFKRAVGHRITEEITAVRLERVRELLRNPDQDIGPIANICGWDSDAYLKRLFKKRFGVTMREWRARLSARSRCTSA